MSQSAITTAFEDYMAQQLAASAPVTLDQFVFANVPDLDPDAPIDRGETVPTEYVVYQQAVTLPGVINNNEVVYSVTMGTDVGDFDFNWIGLVNAATGLLGMVTHAPVQQKFKNADGQQGNTLTRSFLMEYDGAATATNITTPAETWQIDFTARLSGMDERQRLENTDVYGDGAFFGDGFLVSGNPTDGYQIAAGSGYVGGLRVQLDAAQSLNVSAKPIQVYVDACWKGTLTSVWTVQQVITLASTLADYTDPDGTAHYVFAVASIDANGAVTDLRPKGSKDGQAAAGCLQIAKNLSDLSDVDEAHKNLELGTAATADTVTSTTDTTTGRLIDVGFRNFGMTAPPISANINFSSYQFAVDETLYVQLSTALNVPTGVSLTDYAYVNVVGVRNEYNDCVLLLTGIHPNEYPYLCWRAYNNSTGAVSWTVFNLNQFGSYLPLTGGTINGALEIIQDARALTLKNKNKGYSLYISAQDLDGTNKWFVGSGANDDNTVSLHNYTAYTTIDLDSTGRIKLSPASGQSVDIGTYVYSGAGIGSGTFANQYSTYAPYYAEINSSSISSYYPLWKQKDLYNKIMWSGGMLVNSGGFFIYAINSSGVSVSFEFTTTGGFTAPGQIIPGNYSNFDSRYIQGMRLSGKTAKMFGSGADGVFPAGGVCIGAKVNGDWDNNEDLYYASVQITHDGTNWVTIGNVTATETTDALSHSVELYDDDISTLVNCREYRPLDARKNVLYFRDASGFDFYRAIRQMSGSVFIAFDPESSVIYQIENDPQLLVPLNLSVQALDSVPEGCSIDGTWKFDGTTVYQDAAVVDAATLAANTALRDKYAAQATMAIIAIQASAAIGNPRDGDADNLLALQQYVDQLRDVDLAANPVSFPVMPESIK